MKITNQVVENYFNCKYKAHLALKGKSGEPHEYEVLMAELAEAYRPQAAKALVRRNKLQSAPSVAHLTRISLTDGHPLILDCEVETDHFQFRFDALKKVEGKSPLGAFHYTPVMFHHEESLKERDKALLAYAAHVIGQVQGKQPETAFVVLGASYRTTVVRVRKYAQKVGQLLTAYFTNADSPPRLILNRHCPMCEFRNACHQQAIADDDLSLLRGMTESQAAKLRAKGIFTVFQLSHTYRHRRRSKRHRHLANPHSFALQALAIRRNKIHVVGLPDLPDSPIQIYIDVEGDSAGRSVYLIGVLIESHTEEQAYSFWADTEEDEVDIFNQFLSTVARYDDFSVFHFGNYEMKYFERMRKHATDQRLVARLIDRSCNILSVIYSNIYFPTYSNGLKDIGEFLGCRWSDLNASGLQSLVWRYHSQTANDEQMKERLTQYNYEDCVALRKVTETIYRIAELRDRNDECSGQNSAPDANISWVREESPFPSNREWRTTKFEIPDYDYINKAAYFDYQRERVYVRTNPRLRQLLGRQPKKRRRTHRANQRVEIKATKCHLCGSGDVAETGSREFVKQTYDLAITSAGIVRRVTEYHAKRIRCRPCKRVYLPPKFRRLDPYRHSLKAWAMYQHVAHYTSIPRIRTMLWEFFGIEVEQAYVHMMKALLAKFHRSTYKRILERLLSGTLIHADETEFKLKSERGYVWVLTNMEEVYFFYRPSREGTFLSEMLDGFQGVLVSDFYGAYDSLPCAQQKCLIHLIRDFNDELARNPFDEELKTIAGAFGRLLREIVGTVDRWGLRERWLRKHRKDVDLFFREFCSDEYEAEAAESLRNKLVKYRRKLFAFLDHDGVPWNNNNAEHAVKRFAQYRRLADGLMSASGIDDYLVLLSIFVTCQFKGINVLKFLMSRERDIDAFASSPRRTIRRSTVEVYPAGFPERYPRKRRPTRSEHRNIAKGKGLETVFDQAMLTMRKLFETSQTILNGIVFLGSSGKVQLRRILYLLPPESDSDKGLRYNVYTRRFADYFGVTICEARQMLPAYRRVGEARAQAGEFGTGHFRDEFEIAELNRQLQCERWQRDGDREHAKN